MAQKTFAILLPSSQSLIIVGFWAASSANSFTGLAGALVSARRLHKKNGYAALLKESEPAMTRSGYMPTAAVGVPPARIRLDRFAP